MMIDRPDWLHGLKGQVIWRNDQYLRVVLSAANMATS